VVKIALLQLNSTIGAFDANRQKLVAAYQEACARGAEFVLAPELFLCGYPPRDLLHRPDFIRANLQAVAETAKQVGAVPLCVGYVDHNTDRPGRVLRNAAAVLQNGQSVWKTYKSLLPTYDVFDEDRYFEPAQAIAPFSFNGLKLGISICEDIWNDADFWPERLYRRDPVKELIAQGADILLNLSASPWCEGKEITRQAMLQRVARDERVPLAQVNLIGANDELIFDGHSVALNNRGEVLARARGFGEEIVIVDLQSSPRAETEAFPMLEELMHGALTLGIRDYVQKCGFQSVLIGLSGGIDSALVATLAVHALGAGHVRGVAMPSRYSSEGSLIDAEALAKNLGIRYDVLPIEPVFEAVERQLAGVFAGTQPNEAEENIQSRLRGLALMGLSNKFGALVLTTGNKSEMAVGYCTLYGDMCGALAVIADVFKTEVYRLTRWINREKMAIPAATVLKPPSAELRLNQKDQDSLPPYEILDEILAAYVMQNLGPEEIVQRGFAPEVVREVINKVNFSEYKRRQAAPGLRVSARAFGTGRRIPIAQRFRAGF
jgi:NAD+ synthase (glutamine-hydrolysing)